MFLEIVLIRHDKNDAKGKDGNMRIIQNCVIQKIFRNSKLVCLKAILKN